MEKTTDELMKTLLAKPNIEAYLQENDGEMLGTTLPQLLCDLAQQQNISHSEAIRRAGLDRVYGYQLFSGTKENPSRDKLLCLAFGLGLDVDKTQMLLHTAEKPALYPRVRRDSMILFALQQGCTVYECDVLLESHGEAALTN